VRLQLLIPAWGSENGRMTY